MLKGHTGDVNSVAITPDGKRAISGSRDKTIRVWDLDMGKETTLFYADGMLESCAIQGNIIVAGDSLGRVHVLVLE